MILFSSCDRSEDLLLGRWEAEIIIQESDTLIMRRIDRSAHLFFDEQNFEFTNRFGQTQRGTYELHGSSIRFTILPDSIEIWNELVWEEDSSFFLNMISEGRPQTVFFRRVE